MMTAGVVDSQNIPLEPWVLILCLYGEKTPVESIPSPYWLLPATIQPNLSRDMRTRLPLTAMHCKTTYLTTPPIYH